MKTGCKLGSPDEFENDMLYSNAITQQNERERGGGGGEREPGIVLHSRKDMMTKLAF